MKNRGLIVLLAFLALSLGSGSGAQACVVKSGKDCDTTVAHKAKAISLKKQNQQAPAGGVGTVAHKKGFDKLGLPSADVTRSVALAREGQAPDFGTDPVNWFYLAPSGSGGTFSKPLPFDSVQTIGEPILNPDGSLTQVAIGRGWMRLSKSSPVLSHLAPSSGSGNAEAALPPPLANAPAPIPDPVQTPQNFGSNPSGWFYLMPSASSVSGVDGRPLSHSFMSRVSDNRVRHGDGPMINPDGSLTAIAISAGWMRLAAPAPVKAGTQPAPNKVPIQTPSLLAPVPVPHDLVAAPNLLPGNAARSEWRAHPETHVDVYHPNKAGVYRYQDALAIGDPSFHFVVTGFKEPKR